MSWLTTIWSLATAACLTLAVIHLFVWTKSRRQVVPLLFSLMVLGAAGCGLVELMLMFQPVFPFPVGERRNLFFRPAISFLVEQPRVDSTGQVEAKSGFSEIGYDLAYGYVTRSGWRLVGGLVGLFPTGTSALSSHTWTLGPQVAKTCENINNHQH